MSWPTPRRGEVWIVHADKNRPFVVLTRDPMGAYLHEILAAPATSVVRGISTEVEVGPGDGFRHSSVISLDNTQLIHRAHLRRHVGKLNDVTMDRICDALAIAVGCR